MSYNFEQFDFNWFLRGYGQNNIDNLDDNTNKIILKLADVHNMNFRTFLYEVSKIIVMTNKQIDKCLSYETYCMKCKLHYIVIYESFIALTDVNDKDFTRDLCYFCVEEYCNKRCISCGTKHEEPYAAVFVDENDNVTCYECKNMKNL